MFIEGFRLVRPGREADIERARAAKRRTDVFAVIAGIAVCLLLAALIFPIVTQWVSSFRFEWYRHPLVWTVPITLGLVGGAATWWLISGAAERRWKQKLDDPDLTRSGFAFYDFYGGLPEGIPAQELWDALDVRGGVSASPLYERIMLDLWGRRVGPAGPPESEGATDPGSAP
jgi:hypothetical protein